MPETTIPAPTAADLERDLEYEYGLFSHSKILQASLACAAIRLAQYYRQQVEALVGLNTADVDAILDRWDQTEPSMQRLIVRFAVVVNAELRDEVASLHRTNAQIHEAQLRYTHTLDRIIARSEDSDVREIAAKALGRVAT